MKAFRRCPWLIPAMAMIGIGLGLTANAAIRHRTQERYDLPGTAVIAPKNYCTTVIANGVIGYTLVGDMAYFSYRYDCKSGTSVAGCVDITGHIWVDKWDPAILDYRNVAHAEEHTGMRPCGNVREFTPAVVWVRRRFGPGSYRVASIGIVTGGGSIEWEAEILVNIP